VNPEPAVVEAVPPIIEHVREEAPPIARIESLDILRGFAVLGILVMNIQSFSMIEAAYMNPAAYGDLTGINWWVWVVSHVFADQKFMSIFSLLFGAGILLMTDKSQASGKSAGWLHYRRMFWLLVIGLLHAHLFWFGDILVPYALTGCVAFLFRRLRPSWLTLWGILALVVSALLFAVIGLSMPVWTADDIAGLRSEWQPDAAAIIKELELYRGGWIPLFLHRAQGALVFETVVVAGFSGWRVGGLMLLGMALLKWGILFAQRPVRVYTRMIIGGIVVGFPFTLCGIYLNFAAGWSHTYSLFFGSQWNYWGSLGMAIAYVGAVMLLQRQGLFPRIRCVLGEVGRMALTNYLLQTLVCTTLFYGHGLGLYGRLERWQQLLVVFSVWIFLIGFTHAWLQRWRQGPLEHLWRSLTYFRFQPLPRALN
jgi:uncharacterized protein